MVDKKVVQEWLKKADDDFGFAKTNLDDKNTGYFDFICFHLQQAAEKYLKSFIIAKGLKLEKIHNLIALRKICAKINPKFEEIRSECVFLNDFYIVTRYPVILPVNITRQEAETAQQYTEKIGNLVKQTLHDETLL